MSNALVSELYESRSIDARLQRVLVVLCDHANRDGFLWPSVGRIAWYLEISESTVHRSMRALEAMGVLEVRRRPGRSSMYRINLDVLPAKEPYRGPKEPDEWKKYANQANSNPCQNDTPTPVKMPPYPCQFDTHNRN